MTTDLLETQVSTYRSNMVRLLAGVLMVNLFVVALAVFFLYKSRVQGEQLAEARTRNLAQVLAQNVSGTIDKINLILLSTTDVIEKQLPRSSIENLSLESFLARERQYLPELNRILVSNAAGDIVFGGDGAQTSRKSVADRDYFIRLRDNPREKLAISKPVAGVIDGAWIQIFARRISNPDGSFAGVVTGSIRLEHFLNDFSAIKIGDFGSITLRDSDLAVVVRYPAPREPGSAVGQKIIAHQFRELIVSGKTNATYRATYPVDNIERTYTYFKISDYPLYINVGMATRDFLNPWRRQVTWVTGITSIFILLTCFSSWTLIGTWRRDQEAEGRKRRNDKRLKSIVSILQYRAETVQEFLDNALNEAIKLSDSRIGYIYFYLEESRQFVLNSWSSDVMKECSVVNPQTCYDLDKTGFWGEAIRQRRPIILNDFTADDPLKKGYPEGHVALTRFMTVPVFKEDRIVAVVGVANKAGGYDESDVLQLTLLMDVVWKFVENRKGEDERRHLHEIIERSLNEIYVFDAETLLFRHVNQGALSNLQYSLAEIRKLTPLDIKTDLTEPAFRSMIRPLLNNSTDSLTFDTNHRRADGTIYPVEVNLQLVDSDGRQVFLAVINDITDRRLAEENRAELMERLHQAQKLESIGRLAGGVAHDFNNKLMVILGNAELARMDLIEGDKMLEHLHEITLAAEHSRAITAQLLAFSRQQMIIPRALDANRIIAAAQKSLSCLIGEHIAITFVPADNLWSTEIDPVQLDQIIMNLAVNARDAMPEGGTFTIETGNVTLREEECRSINDCVPGEYVRIRFRDDGTGIDHQALRHIFEPFFTTKDLGKGTGLGLSTIYGIIRQNKGFIEVASKSGHGAVFTVYLPRHDSPPDDTAESDRAVPSGSGAILVVEDDTPVRQIAVMFLRKLGYTVCEAESPATALAIVDDISVKLDLVLTDMVMPGMSGTAMMEMIRLKRPDIKVIFVSGYSSDHLTLEMLAAENFIQKPYDMKKLGEHLERLINGEQEA